jgi:hypothetical protein
MEHEANHNLDVDQHLLSNDRDTDSYSSLFKLMVDNDSALLKVIVNELSYLLRNKSLKTLISLFKNADKNQSKYLEILLTSKAFKELFYQKVYNGTSYKHGFEQFFENYLDQFAKNKQSIEVMLKYLSLQPYNASFGLHLIQKYKKCEEMFKIHPEIIINTCSKDLKEFDVYRLGKITDSDLNDFHQVVSKDIKQSES